jgi:hypothetical protein
MQVLRYPNVDWGHGCDPDLLAEWKEARKLLREFQNKVNLRFLAPNAEQDADRDVSGVPGNSKPSEKGTSDGDR